MSIPVKVRAHLPRYRGVAYPQGPKVLFLSLKIPMLPMVYTPTGLSTISPPQPGGWNKVRPMPKYSQMELHRVKAATGSVDTIPPARPSVQRTAIFSVSMLPISTSPCQQLTGQRSGRLLRVICLQRPSLLQRSRGKSSTFFISPVTD